MNGIEPAEEDQCAIIVEVEESTRLCHQSKGGEKGKRMPQPVGSGSRANCDQNGEKC